MPKLVLLVFALAASSYAIPQPKIIGGDVLSIESFPHQAALEYLGRFICGGVIVSNKFILTAGHCLTESDADALKIRVGTSERETGGLLCDVKNIYEHPEHANVDFDIGLVELKDDLNFGDNVQAIKIANKGEQVPSGSSGFVSGWGTEREIQDGGQFSQFLRAVQVPIPSKTTCRAIYPERFNDRMLCAGGPLGGSGPCYGDWGGPLTVDGKLFGIASWGTGCGRPNYPAVYQDVSQYTEFISSHVNN